MKTLFSTIIDIVNSITILGVYIYQEEGKIVFANEAFAKLLGYSKDEILKLTIFDIVYSRNGYIENIVSRRVKGEKFTKEYHEILYKTKSGFVKPTLNFGYTIEYNNKPAGLVVVVDATTQKAYYLLYKSLSGVLLASTASKNENELLEKTVHSLVEDGDFHLAAVGIIENRTKEYKALFVKSKIQEHENIFRNTKISGDENVPEGQGSIGRAYRKRKIVVINNLYKDDGMRAWRPQQKQTGIHAVCSFPVKEYIVTLYSQIPEVFDKRFIHLIKDIQTVLSSAIDRIRNEKWKRIMNTALEQGFDMVIVSDKNLTILYTNNNIEHFTGFKKEELIGKDIGFLLLNKETKKPLNITNGEKYRVVACKRKDKKRADILLSSSKVEEPDGNVFYILTGKDITGNLELQKAIYDAINKDHVTGLLNRNAFIKEVDKFIARAKHKGIVGAVIVIDIVDFSKVSKALGFDKANILLNQISKRLIGFVREYDAVAKFEGDQFGVLIKDIQKEEDVFVVANRLLRELSRPYSINTDFKSIILGFSAGVSIYPFDSESPECLIEKAEIAIPDNKDRLINLGFYRENLKDKYERRLSIESSFPMALKNNEFMIFLQPYVDSYNTQIVGVEALIRWKKNNKFIPPMEFIPILEESRLILDLESWIVRTKLPCLKRVFENRIPVAFNISPVTLYQESFIEELVYQTKKNNIDPSLVRIEITERLFLKDLDRAIHVLDRLKSFGFKIMVDDFGTGYSSLSYLAKLPVDFLKIDISFTKQIVDDDKTRSIVKTIIFISKELKIKTIAEGIETNDQLTLLKDIGCDYCQGYLFYHPMPISSFVKII